MLYLIYVNNFNKDKNELVELLKIGYTSDQRKESRYSQYKMHYPLFKLLGEIPGGNEDDEKLVQKYFNEFRYSEYGLEWFKYKEEIIDFFKNNTTIEKTRKYLEDAEVCISDRTELYKFRAFVVKLVTNVINYKSKLGEINFSTGYEQLSNLVDHIIYEKRIRSRDRLVDHLVSVFNVPRDILLCSKKLDNKAIIEFLDKFESLSLFPDKMRLLCNLEVSKDVMNDVLDILPIIYKNFYNVLGKDRIKMFSYQKYLLQSEYDKQKSKSNNCDKLSKLIFNKFSIGNRYSNIEAKSILKKIYFELNILGNPKATDLYNYFELKICKVSDPISKKRENGFEIIKKKEDTGG